jgi:hypothetical protein
MSDQVKLLLAYDIHAGDEQSYRRFVLEEFLPQAEELGLTPTDAWHTAYGDYPARLIGLVAQDLESARRVRSSEQWQKLLVRLEGYTSNLQQRLVPLHAGFQW